MNKDTHILQPIRKKILSQKEELSQMPPQHGSTSDKTQIVKLTPWRMKLIELYANSIIDNVEETKAAIEQWGADVAGQLVELQLPLNVALEEISYYRHTIGEMIQEEGTNQEMSLKTFFDILTRFHEVMDASVDVVARSYMKDFHRSIEAAKYAIDELTVPVVQLTETTGLIPLIGEIDTNRAQYLSSNALEKGSDLGLNRLIIDVSGVSVIDTMVAGQLLNVMDSLRLIGIEVALSGVRPEVAQTMVSLGIKIHAKIFASLKAALDQDFRATV